jgi:hypothetical protein
MSFYLFIFFSVLDDYYVRICSSYIYVAQIRKYSFVLGGSTHPVGVHVPALPIYSFCKTGQMLMYKLVSPFRIFEV